VIPINTDNHGGTISAGEKPIRPQSSLEILTAESFISKAEGTGLRKLIWPYEFFVVDTSKGC
jgi:hypothetical protein